MFYNTGINTYIWFLTNKKQAQRSGKVQMINAVDYCRSNKKV
jgi:type I restriction enzyme M protein